MRFSRWGLRPGGWAAILQCEDEKNVRNNDTKNQTARSEGKGVSEDGNPADITIPRSIRGEKIAEMLTARELEALLKIDVKTIYAYVQKGLIPYVRIQSNLRFIHYEILNWIDEQSFLPHSTDQERLRK